jgi:hypothetical protein
MIATLPFIYHRDRADAGGEKSDAAVEDMLDQIVLCLEAPPTRV